VCGLRCGCTGSATIDWTLRDLGFVVEHMSTGEYQTMLRNSPERVLSGDIHRVLVRRAQDAFGGLADVMADPRILCRVSALHFWGYYDSANIAAESEEWSRPYRNRDIVFGAKNFVSKEIEPGRARCHSVPTYAVHVVCQRLTHRLGVPSYCRSRRILARRRSSCRSSPTGWLTMVCLRCVVGFPTHTLPMHGRCSSTH
jgi:hypothetical protein